jgi:hypothetical protein
VTAGISVGIFFIDAFLMQFGPFVTVPLQIALITGMIMSFCWVTFWKSLLVVICYAAIQFLLAFLMVLVLGALFKDVVSSGSTPTPGAVPYPPPPSTGDALADLDSHLMAMETGGVPTPTNALPVEQSVPTASVVIPGTNIVEEKPENRKFEDANEGLKIEAAIVPVEPKREVMTVVPVPVPLPGTATPADWAAARKRLRMGGSMVGPSGYYTMIDGKVLMQGETVSVVVAGQRYRWTVTAISKERVDLKPLDAVLVK